MVNQRVGILKPFIHEKEPKNLANYSEERKIVKYKM